MDRSSKSNGKRRKREPDDDGSAGADTPGHRQPPPTVDEALAPQQPDRVHADLQQAMATFRRDRADEHAINVQMAQDEADARRLEEQEPYGQHELYAIIQESMAASRSERADEIANNLQIEMYEAEIRASEEQEELNRTDDMGTIGARDDGLGTQANNTFPDFFARASHLPPHPATASSLRPGTERSDTTNDRPYNFFAGPPWLNPPPGPPAAALPSEQPSARSDQQKLKGILKKSTGKKKKKGNTTGQQEKKVSFETAAPSERPPVWPAADRSDYYKENRNASEEDDEEYDEEHETRTAADVFIDVGHLFARLNTLFNHCRKNAVHSWRCAHPDVPGGLSLSDWDSIRRIAREAASYRRQAASLERLAAYEAARLGLSADSSSEEDPEDEDGEGEDL